MKTLAPLIAIGALRFAPSVSALVDTLFSPSGTADGIYSVRKRGVMFKRPNGEPFAFLVANPGQSRFFVSAFTLADGKQRYSYGLTDSDRDSLGMASMSYSQQSDEAERVWALLNPAPVLAAI